MLYFSWQNFIFDIVSWSQIWLNYVEATNTHDPDSNLDRAITIANFFNVLGRLLDRRDVRKANRVGRRFGRTGWRETILLNCSNPGLFLFIFVSFHILLTNIESIVTLNWEERNWCAPNSNWGLQDGRRGRIHWA